jgi:hypothetical protein
MGIGYGVFRGVGVAAGLLRSRARPAQNRRRPGVVAQFRKRDFTSPQVE